jgi:YwqJ-like deaminase
MQPFGEGSDGGDRGDDRRDDRRDDRQEPTRKRDDVEGRFKERVAKRVKFTLPPGHVDRTTATSHAPRRFDPQAPQILTGARSTHLDEVPRTGKHPLTQGEENELEDGSRRLARRTDDTFRGAYDQPVMAGTFLAGDSLSAHTSMKGRATPSVHPVVQTVLDELEDSGGAMGRGHGRCSEIGTISDYLWNVDPGASMSVETARAHFEYVGGATSAHQTHPDRRGRFHLRPACDTCAYVTKKLAIANLTDEY